MLRSIAELVLYLAVVRVDRLITGKNHVLLHLNLLAAAELIGVQHRISHDIWCHLGLHHLTIVKIDARRNFVYVCELRQIDHVEGSADLLRLVITHA